MRALLLPDYTDANPYQRLLADALAEEGVEVSLRRGRVGRLRFPILSPVRRTRPDVLHLHWTHPFLYRDAGAVSRTRELRTLGEILVARRGGTRVVWTIHNLGRHDHADAREARAHRRLFRSSDAVIVHCGEAVELAIEAFGLRRADADRIHVIPHGHYIDAYPPAPPRAEARRLLGYGSTERLFLALGGIRAYKGLDRLFEAFRSLPDAGARLLVAGRGDDAALMRSLRAAAAGDGRIRIDAGHVPAGRLGAYFGAADVAVLPFREVLTSGSAILAMSFGRGVIAPRLGCLGSTVDERAGILYDPGSRDALRDALARALATDLDALGTAARERAATFDWRAIAKATAAAYRGATP